MNDNMPEDETTSFIGNMFYDAELGYGETVFSDNFFNEDRLIQLDALQGIIGDLNYLYEEMLSKQISPKEIIKSLPDDSVHFQIQRNIKI